MRVEALSVVLRPRLTVEASDLGIALARAHARSVWRSFAPVFLVFLALACATVEIAPWLPLLLIFWFKPWLDCCLLFALSRAVFGQATGPADPWRLHASVWGRQWLRTLLWQRLSPWRAFTQPIFQLEGQRGKPLRQRCKLLLAGQRGKAWGIALAFLSIEIAFGIGLLAALSWFKLEGNPLNLSGSLSAMKNSWGLLLACGYGAIVLAVEPFYVAAGLTLYLNRRVELEAWDIEQEFRRAF